MATRLVRGVRSKLNGHSKVVGGFSLAAIGLTIFGILAQDKWASISYAGARMPVVDRWMLDHQTWSDTAYRDVVNENKDTVERIGRGLESAKEDRALIRSTVNQRFDDKLEFDKQKWDNQAAWNEQMLGLMIRVEAKLDRAIEKNP